MTITNRGDCCYQRLSNFEIRIGNSLADNGNHNPKCGGFYSLGSAETKKIYCPAPMKGRYVNIRIPGSNNILTLCEVEVHAEGNYNIVLILGRIRSVSKTLTLLNVIDTILAFTLVQPCSR